MLGSTGSVPYWRVIDPLGAVLQDVSYGGYDKDVTTLTSTGSYLLLVEGVRGATGTSSLSFNVRAASVKSEPMVPGETVNGSIDVPGQTSRFTFDLASQARMLFDALSYNTNFTCARGSQGNVVSNRSYYSSDGTSNQPWMQLAAGSYELVVDGTGEAVGAFQFRLLDIADAKPVTTGTVVAGVLSPVAAMDMYKLSLKVGDRITWTALPWTGMPTTSPGACSIHSGAPWQALAASSISTS